MIHRNRRIGSEVQPESGYALPFVLMMITILSVVTVSVISIVYFQRQQAFLAVANTRAEYAAESGVARLLSGCVKTADIDALIEHGPYTYAFADGSDALVSAEPWGILLAVTSDGRFKNATSTQLALVADIPAAPFANALVFGNQSHQLVFSGDAHVKGDIVVGEPGVSTGRLDGNPAPSSIPVDGRIQRMDSSHIPDFHSPLFARLVTDFNTRLPGPFARGEALSVSHRSPSVVHSDDIPDSLRDFLVVGDLDVRASINRRDIPLRIAVRGNVTLGHKADLRGLVAIYASGRILISAGCSLEHILVVSGHSIAVGTGVRATVQLIAPIVHVDEGAALMYPSYLVSTSLSTDSLLQSVTLSGGSRIEGLVLMIAESSSANLPIVAEAGAIIVGAVYSQSKLTLDGTVVGSVLTRDFFFHHHSTTYFGWLRGGTINRALLPGGFLTPPGFATEARLGVLDWI